MFHTQPKLSAGMHDGIGPRSIESHPAESTIKFGAPVVLNPNGTVKEANTAGAYGFATLSHTHGPDSYKATDTVSVMTTGRLAVRANGEVAVNDRLTLDTATGEVKRGGTAFTGLNVIARTSNPGGQGLVIVEVSPK